MQDPAALARLAGAMGGPASRDQRHPDIGACFQLALLAAVQHNDQEAGDYLRRVISAMKEMAGPGETDAGSGPNP